jgi:RHO protein GDP dissociation inhibitor
MTLPIPFEAGPKTPAFVLKDGSKYRLKFNISVSNNIVLGLRYTNTVWKKSIRGNTCGHLLLLQFQHYAYTFYCLLMVLLCAKIDGIYKLIGSFNLRTNCLQIASNLTHGIYQGEVSLRQLFYLQSILNKSEKLFYKILKTEKYL